MLHRFLVPILVAVCGFLLPCYGQLVSGSISGRVVDPSGAPVEGAEVTLLATQTGAVSQGTSSASGEFQFPAVQSGQYLVRIAKTGFQTYERRNTNLSANERLSLGDVALALGAVSEKVVVEAEGTAVQTASSEHSAQLTSNQIGKIMTRGRDVMSLMRLMPGVAYGGETESVGDNLGTQLPVVQGGRREWATFNVDGMAGNDLGNPDTASSSISMDAIAEVKVLLNNYQAEYGRNGGAFINVVTKSGTKDFHGSAYYFKRHEKLNANDFFNNLNGRSRPIYRHDIAGFTFGGPVSIPGLFNNNREKLFFFYSFENLGTKSPRPLSQVTVPTALERNGDFSQSYDLNRQLIVIRDPLTGQALPGNVVPQSRVNVNGRILMNVFPLPNATNLAVTGGSYNYNFLQSWDIPKRQHMFRIDYQPTDRDRINFRGSLWRADNQGYGAPAGATAAWDLLATRYLFRDQGMVVNYVRTISPTMVNEFMAGARHSMEAAPALRQADLEKLNRKTLGMTLGQFNPQNNPFNLIPMASFGGVPQAAAISWDGRLPMRGADTAFNFSDTLSIIRGGHTVKLGIFADRGREYEGEDGTFAGNISFARDVNNPLDANYAYANAALGNYASYVESTSRPGYNGRQTTVEWFVQDTWRVTRKLTLDFGMRFAWYTPWTQKNGTSAAFSLERYQLAQAPVLYRPTLDSSGRRAALNPLTGAIAPAVLIGAYVPGSGDPINGMVLGTDSTYPAGFKVQQPVQYEPRFGFAYDVFGDGKTAIRGGFGLFHNTRSVGGPPVVASKFNPPRQFNPTQYYGSLDTVLNSSNVLFPSGTVYGFEKNAQTPSLYNYSFGVQRDIGFQTVLEVGYSGNVARHLMWIKDLNVLPYGTRFQPGNVDPANPAVPIPDNFLRPYPGYGSVRYYENAGTSNYNALQVSVNRRYAKGLQMGASYTYSKTMNFGDNDQTLVATYLPVRSWNYGLASTDQTHVFTVNYIWDIPRASKVWNNGLVRNVLDNWQLAGITALVSGQPGTIGFTTTDAVDLTGGGDGIRPNVVAPVPLSSGDRSFYRWFNTAAVARPAKGDFGNAGRTLFRLPGVSNWDISVFKNIPMFKEKAAAQFRCEFYNAFNHTQFAGVDSTARFDPQGNQTNPRFGQVTSTRTPRVIQLSLRLSF
ncbi:MAG TPA: carboxypeptidase-like regulatory domain-containing protein [Bryobacteraceae bacterium]|nr:carboxypeptidase-like regulatory domain-containing protein [Bryobacteraceae bacterium]